MAKTLDAAAPAPAGTAWGRPADGEAVTVSAAATVASSVLPDLPTNQPFVLAAHPRRFQLQRGTDGKPRIVPALTAWHLEPGRSNIDLVGNRPSIEFGETRRRNAGWVHIPHAVDGPGTSYLRRVRVRGGYSHITRFEAAYPGEQATQRDDDAYLAWLEDLMRRDVLPRPSPQTLERMLGDAVRVLTDLRKLPDREDVRARIEAAQQDVDVLRAAISGNSKRRGTPAPTEDAGGAS